jgi:hypothetical protein
MPAAEGIQGVPAKSSETKHTKPKDTKLIDQQEDTIVQSVIKKFLDRSALGHKKYGTTLDRTDLKALDWIQHAQEELMDGILYLERLKKEMTPPK